MARMFDRNYYRDYSLTCPFGQDREYMEIEGYKYHEGIDYSHCDYRYVNIINLFSGTIYDKFTDKYYGNVVKIKSNPVFAGGVNDEFFTSYCHLEKWMDNVKSGFCEYGKLLGIMGNTGNSTGMHLHVMCFQKEVKENHETPLLKGIIEKLQIKNDITNYNWQFVNNGVGVLYINPLIIEKYFEKIQGV
jgi:hypothetical protein